MKNTALATKDEALTEENTNKIIQFGKKKTDCRNTEMLLSVLMDFEIDEGIFILQAIKREKNEERKSLLEEDFWTLVRSAWAREMESDF